MSTEPTPAAQVGPRWLSRIITALGMVLVVPLFPLAVKIVPEYQRGVIFRLGRLVGARGPGLFLIIPIVERMVIVDLRIVTMDVPRQDVITRDNVTVKVDAVIYFRVTDPDASVVKVMDYIRATSLVAQTTLRSILGQSELDDLLTKREQLNQQLQKIIDDATEPWGVRNAGPRSSTPRASSRRPRSWPTLARSWPPPPPPSSFATSRPSPRSQRSIRARSSSQYPSTSSASSCGA